MRASDLALVAAALLAACTSDPPADEGGGCRGDHECPDGHVCVAEACVDASGGGGGPATDACGSSTACREGPAPYVPDVTWDGEPGVDRVCTVPVRSCPGDDRCHVPTVCADIPGDATRPGGVRCSRDEQCWSGRCLEAGVCHRTCRTDADCPRGPEASGAPGLACEDLVEGNVPLSACLPADPAAPARTLCRNDCDCSYDDACTPPPDGARCRLAGAGSAAGSVPLCEPVPAAATRPIFAVCRDGGLTCEGGACVHACDPHDLSAQHFCHTDPARCSAPCGRDRDCPDRTVCAAGWLYERVGSFAEDGQDPEYPGRVLRYCALPRQACLDEVHCCPGRDADGSCIHGWGVDEQRCGVELVNERLLTICREPDGRGVPGTCCATHEACDSDLCVPAREGTACAGGGVCSVPCDPDPDPDGVPGSGDERDRCAEPDFGNAYHRASTCRPFTYPVGAREVTLHACQ